MTQMISAPLAVDLAEFSSDAVSPRAMYGLPQKIEFCANCLYSNQKPNSTPEFSHNASSKKDTVRLGENDICSACQTIELKKEIDWEEREQMLWALCDRHRSKTGQYDCLVPGSGGKDSVFASHILKYKFGMNPLTVTWSPHLYTSWGWDNFQAWMGSGVDNYLFTPNKKINRLLTRLAVERLFHPFQPFIMGQMYFPPKMANRMGIDLIFYGENPTEYGNNDKSGSGPVKETSYFLSSDNSNIMIGGFSVDELISDFGVAEGDLAPFLPPKKEEFINSGSEVHYLGYYLRWHPQSVYYYARENCGFMPSPERTLGTYSKYSSIDDKIDDFHYYTTFIKFGIGRATYDASQEIREGDIDREEGVSLVRRYDGEWPERFAEEIFNYLSIPESEFGVASRQFERPIMDREYFHRLTDTFRSPHIWKWEDSQWRLRNKV